ncbi:MAG TPA: GNAT family N-acetyltransferase, partial [Acidimicrobiia bacterium]|nr:GNAT family N-acetyltransferase [Acidimicrobiia bacterium]
MPDPVIDRYLPDDMAEVQEVLKLALGERETSPRTPEFWHWKHFENPFGPSLLLVARMKGQIAGIRAYLRWRFRFPGGELKALRAVDTATHPDHLREGIFRSLTIEANRRAEEEGIDLIFNTPNEKSRPGYLAMGWKIVGKPRVYVRPLRPPRRLPGGPSGVSDFSAGSLTDVADLVDRAPLGIRTIRDIAYLDWRFRRHPQVAYRQIEWRQGRAVARANRRAGRLEIVASEIFGTGSMRSGLRGLAGDYVVASARPKSPEARVM